MRILLPSCLLIAVACSTSQSRTVQGRLAGTTSQAIVFSETTSGAQTATEVSPAGLFKLDLPTDQPVTLLIGVRESGRTRVVAHVGPTWFRVRPGGTIDLGVVRPEGSDPTEQLAPANETPVTVCPGGGDGSGAELPYDAKLSLGQTWQLAEAFAEKGPQPSRVVSVTMDGSSWRLTELQSGAPFTVTQADCDHAGNRDVGRDRAIITWENADGTTETDHLDLRYCEAGVSTGSLEDPTAPADEDDSAECDEVIHEGCGDSGSSCDNDLELEPVEGGACPGEANPGMTSPPAPVN